MPAKPFALAVKAVIYDTQGRCLLVKRSTANKNFVGCWEWPGGKVDPGEDFATALHREVMEEASLTIELTGFAGAVDFEMPAVQVVLLCLEARRLSGEVRLSHEHDDSAWVRPAEFARFQLLPRLTDFMAAYARRRENPGAKA